MSIRECYPFTRFPDLSDLETWAIGTKGTCHYGEPTGRQVYGICCEGVADQVVTKDSAVIDTKQKGTCGKGPKSVPPTTVDSKNRIVGGTEARRGDWPFQVMKTCTNVTLLVNHSFMKFRLHCSTMDANFVEDLLLMMFTS